MSTTYFLTKISFPGAGGIRNSPPGRPDEKPFPVTGQQCAAVGRSFLASERVVLCLDSSMVKDYEFDFAKPVC